jgi:hypothetical protein
MIINENGVEQWKTMLTENFNVTDQSTLGWVSQYAANHEIYESSLGQNAHYGAGMSPLYANPANTLGIGNPMAPQNPSVTSTAPAASGNQWNQSVGSGDIPVSTLPMALNIALLTIGFELIPTIPSKGPWQMLSYMDFPYAGGKIGRTNETAFDGIGDDAENKPIYFKVLGDLDALADLARGTNKLTPGTNYNISGNVKDTKAGVIVGKFIGMGRMDGGLIFETVSAKRDTANISIAEVFANGNDVTVNGVAVYSEAHPAKVDFVQTSVDLVDGFANFATGKKEAMTRAQNETGTGNAIGLRLYSKWVQMGSYEVTGTVTRQQLQDLPLYGVDAVAKVMEQMQNELTQHINQRILERVFRLGVTNAVQQKAYQDVDLNLYLGTTGQTGKALSTFGLKEYQDIYGVEHAGTWGSVKNSEALTSAENTHTRQRRIASRILAAANLINVVGRRGRATWVVTNYQVATALQDVAGYIIAPMANNMAQDGSQNLFLNGTLAGLKVYVDPFMAWNDTRVCVGRKGDANSPGVVFLPYILADQVSITAEGTMAPKMLLNSRFAIAEIGYFPEAMYYTFGVYSDFGLV